MTGCALGLLLLIAPPSRAGDSMTSASNNLIRNVVNSGGQRSTATNGSLIGSAGEGALLSASASASSRVRGGWSELHAFPGPVGAFIAAYETSETSGTLNFTAPGADGSIGALAPGASYLVRVASYTAPNTLDVFSYSNFSVSTNGVTPGDGVGVGPNGLIANTTYFAQIWTVDASGNLSTPAAVRSTFTTLARAPSLGQLEFLSISVGSASIDVATVTVAWVALPPIGVDVASMSASGYVLLASSNNFGAIGPPGAPVFSSSTYALAQSTLTLGTGGAPLDLTNTYYFQVASVNWNGQKNYTQLPRLNFQMAQSTFFFNMGGLNPDVSRSAVSMSSMVITNVGNWPMTLSMQASTATAGGSPWALSTSPGIETATLQAQWNASAPAANSFSTFLTTNTVASQNGGNFAGGQSGYQLAPGASASMWFYFTMPTSSESLGPERIRVMTLPSYP